MNYLLGIDFGGGSAKATLLRPDGTIAAERSEEYATLHPAPGWCEQRPEDWFAALCACTNALFAAGTVRPDEILALALDSATHTAVLCDDAMRPLRPAIHWTDSRSAAEAALLRETAQETILAAAYHKPDPIWTLPQLVWVREHEPAVFGRIRHILFEKDYLRYLLTGTVCTDCIEAEGSMLFDFRTQAWSEPLAALAGIPLSVLPEVKRPTDSAGSVTASAAAATGLLAGTPVIVGTTDTVLEVFASGAVAVGDVTVKLATAGRICVVTDRAYPHPYLINYSHVVPGLWYPGTATKAAASAYRWFRDTFGENYRALDAQAASVAPGAEGLFFHPYLNGELTPYADPALCGSFTGVRAHHTKAHFTRAVLEGVGYSMMDCNRALGELGISHKGEAVAIGGGAKSPLWRQILADMLGMPLTVPESADSSLGAAMLAGIAAGVFRDPAEAAKVCVRPVGRTEPDPARTAFYEAQFATYRRITEALAPIYHTR